MSQCPLCEKKCNLLISSDNGEFIKICPYTRMLWLSDEIILSRESKEKEANVLYDMIFSDLISHRKTELTGRHYVLGDADGPMILLEEDDDGSKIPVITINARYLQKQYPNWMMNRYDRVLINAYHLYNGMPFSEYHSETNLDQYRMCLSTGSEEYEEENILDSMTELGYFIRTNHRLFFTRYAWERLTELVQKHEGSKTAFIALGYNNTEKIRATIKAAVEETGYKPVVMDEIEHNNQIMPEMIGEIKRCRFLVMDSTSANLGAYYETGIAFGLGKPTIITCSKEAHNASKNLDSDPLVGLHFDIAQQSAILWKDHEDLHRKLVRRIQSTIN